MQAKPVAKPDVDDTWISVPADVGDVKVRIVKPAGATGMLPTLLYVHGGGWILGNAGTHDRLVRELAVYYPVTDAAQDTESYRTFADGPYLTAKAMAWFWDAYLPEVDRRGDITVSPLRATLDDLAGLPPAYIVVDETTCCGTRARPTPASSPRPACRPPASATTARSTTS